MIKQKLKNQKPIDIDAHFKYRCPNCGGDHWLSLKESQTKNFKIACDCNIVFKPKRIKNIKIEYLIKDKIIKDSKKENTIAIDSQSKPINKSVLDQCCKLLSQYGFTKEESKAQVVASYNRIKTENIGMLIKNILEFIGDHKDE